MSDHRVVVQERCLNGRFHADIEEPQSCCDHWPDGDRRHREYEPCPTATFCDGSPTRVLEPGSYVLIEKDDDGEWPYDVSRYVRTWLLDRLAGDTS